MSGSLCDQQLAPLFNLFPQRQAQIVALYHADAAFQELCEELAELLRMVERLRNAPEVTVQRILSDYECLLQELYLDVHTRMERGDPSLALDDEEANEHKFIDNAHRQE